jgi:serine/threonine-protein kinase
MNLDIGTQLGDYRILRRIGRGAYGIVFEAEHVITRRIDALKLMLDAGPSAIEEEQRFLREIQVQASLQHPNIAQVYTAFRTPWGLALAMEMVRGEPLSAILRRVRPSLSEGVGYILATLSGLSCAEQMGIVHRDIKPDNILITQDGGVKITDFGLAQIRDSARITASGESLGTPCYMSPEQVTGSAPADARTDVYSTGVVLYEVMTGKPPFGGPNGFAVMLAHQNTAPVAPSELDPSIGQGLSRAILKALEKDPSRRFPNAGAFREALEEAMSQREVTAMPQQPSNRVRRQKYIAAVVGIASACLGGLLAWGAHVAMQPGQPVAHAPANVPAAVSPASPADSVPVQAESPSPAGSEATASQSDEARPRNPRRRPAFQPRPTETPTALTITAVEAPPEKIEPKPKPKQVESPADIPAPVPTSRVPEKTLEALPEPVALPLPSPKKPNVFKRALTRILGKRENRSDAPENAAAPGGKSKNP